MFLKISQNSQENTCGGVSTYQFNSQSMGRPDKRRKQPLEVFCKKKVFLKIYQISQENTCVGVSF